MTELQLVNLDRAIQSAQAHPVLAIVGAVLSVVLWFYVGTIGKTTVAKKR